MKIRVNEKLWIENPTPAIEKWCKQNLVLDNPDYYKKLNMGRWVGDTPSEIALYERRGNELVLPFGCLNDVWKICVRGLSWHTDFAQIRPFNYQSAINLYPYQEKAVTEAIARKNGVLVMPCGSGKTQCGIEIISRIGGRALWLTHTQELLNQSKDRAKSVLGNVGLGTITAGKVNLGNGITFATVQTLAKLDISQYRDFWDIVIVDECQHCAGTPTKVTQFYKVTSNLCARYKYGLTATPKRADGLERAMFVLLGDVVHEVKREEIEDKLCPVKVRRIETGWFPNDDVFMGDGTIDYAKLVWSLTNDEDRYAIVLGDIVSLDGSMIVLANRVEYLKRLSDDLIGCGKRCICLSGMGQSKQVKKERKEALRKLNDGEIDCVLATYALAKEGLDVPNLRYVIFATPEQDETTVIQSVGRVSRKAEDKEYGTVIDFIDNFGVYKKWAKKRESYYRKIECYIEENG